MSWLKHIASGEAPATHEPADEQKIKDPSIPGRMISDKPANRPFLAYKEYREKREASHEAWVERQKERELKLDRGEEAGPPEPDPTIPTEIGMLGILKFLFYVLIFTALAGKFVTGSYTWDYHGNWTGLRNYWPTNQRLISERVLAEHDGSIPGKPIYLAIDGDVYDVSQGKAYQPGGSYSILAGVDAARAFGTGCFKTHRTHDTREMTQAELDSLAHWKKFYLEHKDYMRIGRVSHRPIDPASPIPRHCDPKKEIAAQQARKTTHKEQNTRKDRREL